MVAILVGLFGIPEIILRYILVNILIYPRTALVIVAVLGGVYQEKKLINLYTNIFIYTAEIITIYIVILLQIIYFIHFLVRKGIFGILFNLIKELLFFIVNLIRRVILRGIELIALIGSAIYNNIELCLYIFISILISIFLLFYKRKVPQPQE